MSRCLGSSNQSRERNRRWGKRTVASDAMGHNSLWQAGHLDARAEQAAGQRLLLAFLGVERHVRRGDVKRLQVVVTERGLGDGRAGQVDLADQFARWRVALQAPAAEHAGPDTTFG